MNSLLSPVFLDIEASGLAADCYPIEVGWASVDGAGAIVTDAMLIRPPEEWLVRGAWDPIAQQLHGISLDDLLRVGKYPMDVAQRMNERLRGRILYSDSAYDGDWVQRLFEDANERMAFEMALKSADTLIVELADRLAIGDLDYTAAEREAARRAPRTHRAAADATYWATLWRLVRDGYRAEPDARPELGSIRMKP
jgi:DNA polymerase III epsilon subunit-like protein